MGILVLPALVLVVGVGLCSAALYRRESVWYGWAGLGLVLLGAWGVALAAAVVWL